MASHGFTTYGWIVCLWVLGIAFQYGYHISALNQIQGVLTCEDAPPPGFATEFSMPTCIPMSLFSFSVITSIFTVGGLVGSMFANLVMERWGRKGATKLSAFFITCGAGIMGLSTNVYALAIGRLMIGIGSGVGLCVAPIYLAEIAPSRIRGNVGVLTQLGIVLGIMITQAIGIRLATPTLWRVVLFISCALSAAQLLFSSVVAESPVWLASKGRMEESVQVQKKLWSSVEAHQDTEDPLLDESFERLDRSDSNSTVSVPQLLVRKDLRKPLVIVCSAMLSQQLSGINAVLYYSNNILSNSLPKLGPYVSLGITIINVLMTFPPIVLIERMGRRRLLLVSILGALLSLSMVGFGLNNGFVTLSSVAIISFVMSFAVGLGPVPFVLIPEVSPAQAVSALSSVALSMNWIVNFFVGLVFLPLRDVLAGDDPSKGGRVFYVFAAILSGSAFVLLRKYRG
ncbi:hypothetical protein AX15_005051 [Amanita polypyramis BW_CC]|nr:hypothetical protein AX15_005051 [Amanita polypyramis BW_CC]